MPVLRYWDTTQNAYVAIPGPPGQAYAAVQSTAPPATNPTVAPPNGLLWVDTGTPASLTFGAAYYPPQTPPATGTNTFTDSSGEIWFSKNGSAWIRARDIRTRVYRNAAFTPTAAAWVVMPLDVAQYDTFSLWTLGTGAKFTCPVAGDYLLQGGVGLTATASGDFIGVGALRNGTSWDNPATVAGVPVGWGQNSSRTSTIIRCSTNDTLQLQTYSQLASAFSVGNISTNYCAVSYMGPSY